MDKTKYFFYPVIHVKSESHAIRNALLAQHCGADGVFLINMGDTTTRILRSAHDALSERNDFKIQLGINFLTNLGNVPDDLSPATMLWSDTFAGYHRGIKKHVFFGPFAFKYQDQPTSIENELPQVETELDVITTSGIGTGEPPTLSKIQRMHKVATKPIAIASGINAENVVQFKPYANIFLVGSSIGYDELIMERVLELAKIIHD